MVFDPCFHLVFVSEHKFTSIIMCTVLTNDVLICAVHLFNDMDNTITIWKYCGKFLFLWLRLCQPDGMLCHTVGVTAGSICLHGLSHLASLLQVVVDFEPCNCILLFYSFVYLFIPTPGFRSPLLVHKKTAASSRGSFQVWLSGWLQKLAVLCGHWRGETPSPFTGADKDLWR